MNQSHVPATAQPGTRSECMQITGGKRLQYMVGNTCKILCYLKSGWHVPQLYIEAGDKVAT